jgi:hypothetical protein
VIALISSNFSLLARTQICPECSPLHVFSAMSSPFLKFNLIDNLRMGKSQRLVQYEIL